jgi:branched-chain amino acid transport system substrate-binding protein
MNVNVGMFIDQTGANAVAGSEQAQVVPMAVDDINKNSKKVNMTVKLFNAQSDAATAVALVQQATSDPSFTAFAGPGGSIEAPAVNPLLAKDGRPTIVQVSNLTGRGPNMFSDFPSTVDEQQAMVAKVLIPKGVKTLGMIWQDIPTFVTNVNTIKAELQGKGIQIVADQGGSATATDFGAQATAVMAAKPDAISIQCLPTVSGPLVVLLRQRGYKGLLVGQEAHGTTVFPKGAGASADGFIFPTRFEATMASTPEAKKFVADYQGKYNVAPSQYGVFAWTSLHVFATAIEAANSTDRGKIIAQLTKLKFNTLFGPEPVQFDSQSAFLHLPVLILQYDAQGNKTVFK